jgi:hypothetical protein
MNQIKRSQAMSKHKMTLPNTCITTHGKQVATQWYIT